MKTYTDKDMVDAVVNGEEVQIPKAWIGTELVTDDIEVKGKAGKAGKASEEVTLPEGDPTDEWSRAQLDKHAVEVAKVDEAEVRKAGNKGEVLDLIDKANVV